VHKILLPALAILALAGSQLGATTAKSNKRHRSSTTTAHAPAKKTTKTTVASKTSRTVSHHRGKSSHRTARTYYQQVPSPERYKEIQQALATKGFYQGEVNGQWGPDSIDALKRFQTSQNLMPDGKISSLSLIGLGLGPKRLTAKSDTAPVQPGTPAPLPTAPQQ